MSHLAPLTPAELLAARRRHEHRLNELRRRGWQRVRVITKSDVYDLALDRALLKIRERP